MQKERRKIDSKNLTIDEIYILSKNILTKINIDFFYHNYYYKKGLINESIFHEKQIEYHRRYEKYKTIVDFYERSNSKII